MGLESWMWGWIIDLDLTDKPACIIRWIFKKIDLTCFGFHTILTAHLKT